MKVSMIMIHICAVLLYCKSISMFCLQSYSGLFFEAQNGKLEFWRLAWLNFNYKIMKMSEWSSITDLTYQINNAHSWKEWGILSGKAKILSIISLTVQHLLYTRMAVIPKNCYFGQLSLKLWRLDNFTYSNCSAKCFLSSCEPTVLSLPCREVR